MQKHRYKVGKLQENRADTSLKEVKKFFKFRCYTQHPLFVSICAHESYAPWALDGWDILQVFLWTFFLFSFYLYNHVSGRPQCGCKSSGISCLTFFKFFYLRSVLASYIRVLTATSWTKRSMKKNISFAIFPQ